MADVNSETPTSSVYLELPWLPTNLVIRDSTMYISRFFFFGGSIFTYDMRNPNASLIEFLDTDNNQLTDFELDGDHLFITDISDDRLLLVDLVSPNPSTTPILGGFDTPTGISVDDGLLYVSLANFNSNATSRVNIYDFSNGIPATFLQQVASGTNEEILDVARLNGETYVLESTNGEGSLGYLLRIQDDLSNLATLPSVKVTVFPNPTTDYITLRDVEATRINVTDVNGRNVLSVLGNDKQVDLSGLPSGSYNLFVELTDGTVGTAQVIKE
ncbi:MAG: T9SS type A sorting domain-containing protein [Bacteroidota bacterium]